MNTTTMLVNLGAEAEVIKLGEREGRKLRVCDNTFGKKSIPRWLNAIVTGKDVEVADRLVKGDMIALVGTLSLEEYTPKKPKYKGERVKVDVMPYAKILQVIKSPTFFGTGDEAASDDGVTATEAPDLGTGEEPTDDLPF